MSLTSRLNGKTRRDKELQEILGEVMPGKEAFYTLSNKQPFSREYKLLVPSTLSNSHNASLVGTAFDYLARFRIAQFLKRKEVNAYLVAAKGYNLLINREEFLSRNLPLFEPYVEYMKEITAYIHQSSAPISTLYKTAVHLAKLEQLTRSGFPAVVDIDDLLFNEPPNEITNDLDKMMNVFETNFMVPDIIHRKSKVEFNPSFGASSALVEGADADLWIDGTLYDFKTTKSNSGSKQDILQMVGYYLLNEIAMETNSDLYNYQYSPIRIDKFAFYKARFGETEYYDIGKDLPYNSEKLKRLITTLANYFEVDEKNLYLIMHGDAKGVKKELKRLRDGKFFN